MSTSRNHRQVLQVTSDDLWEFACGKTRSTLTLFEHLRRRGVAVEVVSPPAHSLRFLVRAFCYVVARIDQPTGKVVRHYTYALPFMWRRLARAVDGAEASGTQYVVHAHDFLSLLAFERLRAPGSLARAVLTMHCQGSTADELVTEGFLRKGGMVERVIRSQEARALATADAVVVQSSRGKRELLIAFPDLDAEKVSVIPNPVEIAHAHAPVSRADLGIAQDAFLVFVASRLKRVKRLDLLLEAADRSRHEIPGLRVVVAGEGHTQRQIMADIRRRGLDDVVLLLGRRADVPDLMELADVVALTSERESFGRALAEGAVVGRSLLAFDVGGVDEIIVGGQTGLLVPFGDIQGFCDALVRLAADPDERRRLADSACEHSALFAPQKVTDAYLDLFDQLCSASC